MSEPTTELTPITAEVNEANMATVNLQEFSMRMTRKMQKHHGRWESRWFERDWTEHELDLEIQRCVLEKDYVSAANFCMFADYFLNRNLGGCPAPVRS